MGHGSLIDPGPIHHMAAVDEVGRKLGLLHTDGQHIRSAHRLAHIALSDHAGRQSGASGVPAANNDLGLGGQAHSQQDRVDQISHHIRGLDQRRQFVDVDTDLFTDLLGPHTPSRRLIQQGIGGVGVVDGEVSGQHHSDQSVHMAKVPGLFIDVRQISLDPEHGGAGHGPCHGAVGGDLKQALGPDGLAEDLRLLRAAPV